MIKVQDIYVDKGKKRIIQGASFQVRQGQISVIVGKNGAGKSTLFEAITGKNQLADGQIVWDGIDFNALSAPMLAIRRAVLSQKVNVSFSITVRALVEMGTYVATESLPSVKIDHLVKNALKAVELLDFQDRDFTTLSGGEQKRVLLAKCIVQLNCCHWGDVSKYLFLDEPTASLDIEQQYKLIELVRRFVRRRNIGVFAVLHDLNLAAQFADEIIVLRDGALLQKGTPREVLTPEIIRQAFDVHALVHVHPIYNCPLITTIPQSNNQNPFVKKTLATVKNKLLISKVSADTEDERTRRAKV